MATPSLGWLTNFIANFILINVFFSNELLRKRENLIRDVTYII